MAHPRMLVALMTLGLALAAGGAYASLREAQPYLAGGSNSVARIAAMTAENVPPTLSYEGQRGTLRDCELLTRSMYAIQMRRQPAATRPQLLANCRAIAESIAATAPTDTYAWLVAAQAAARQGDMSAAIPHYIAAVQSGPNEQWLGQMRVTFAEKYLDHLTPEALKLHEADMRMLAQSHNGIAYLARRYALRPEFRARITEILDSVPDSYQSIFIFNLRQQIERMTAL